MIILSPGTIMLPSGPIGSQAVNKIAAQVIEFSVSAITSGNGYYIGVRWYPYPENSIFSYNVYKSIVGFQTPTALPFGLIPGDTLDIMVDNTTVQTITFPREFTVIKDMVDFLNTVLVGAKAFAVGNKLMVRDNTLGFIEVVGGTAMSKLGQTARRITEKSEFFLTTNVLYGINSFNDMLGLSSDWYSLSTMNKLGVESTQVPPKQAVPASGFLCHIQGYIIDLQGRRITDVAISARLVAPPRDYNGAGSLLEATMSTLSQEDGTFQLDILQGTEVIFEINKTRVSDAVIVPYQDYIDWNELPLYSAHRYIDLVSA